MARILVVDDDPAVREAVIAALSAHGHEVTATETAVRVEAVVSEVQPDVVVLDIMMPDRDGFEALVGLRRHFPNLSVLVVSGGGAQGNLQFLSMAQRLGAVATLAKPFNGGVLSSVIETLLGSRASTKD